MATQAPAVARVGVRVSVWVQVWGLAPVARVATARQVVRVRQANRGWALALALALGRGRGRGPACLRLPWRQAMQWC